MEKNATPQEKLNWRFQQGLYRAYYDAYVKARLHYELDLEKQALEVLSKANQLGAIKAVDQAETILDKSITQKVRPEWRARTFELAETLFQSIRMQLSVEKYQPISVKRGANLDNIDKPLNNSKSMKKDFDRVRKEDSEQERLARIRRIKGSGQSSLQISEISEHKSPPADWPTNWRTVYVLSGDKIYQAKDL